jgi:signal recognition particle subunit SEC65
MDDAAKKWVIVYPLYLDKSRSVSGGRRVPAALAVEKPQAEEIAQVLK